MNFRDEMNKHFNETIWFSVIVPIYNAEQYLSYCIDSILNQSFRDFELILVDDGSTDHSKEVCRQFALLDKRVSVLTKKNEGAFSARIYGTQYAKGKYIIFCDADDRYRNSACFQKMFELTKGEKYDLVQFGYYKKYNHMKRVIRSVNENVEVLAEEFYHNDYPLLLCSNYSNSRLTTPVWNKIYKRELFEGKFASDISERLFMGDDIVTNLCVLDNCRNVLFTPEILYVYNDLTGGTTKFRSDEMDDLNKLKEYQLKCLKKWTGGTDHKIKQLLFGEMAAWFFLFIQQAMLHMDIKSLEKLIEKVLEYPSFAEGKRYYLEHQTENWMAVNLLRKGSVKEYIKEAKKAGETRRGCRKRIKDGLLKLYKWI